MALEKVINKIKKVLALSSSPFPDEAQTAILKAQELMLQYGLSMTDIKLDNKENNKNVVDESAYEAKRLLWWKKNLTVIIGDNFRCYPYILKSVYSRVCFIGLQEDVELAKEVYLYALDVIDYLSVQYAREHKHQAKISPNYLKNEYIMGFLDGLADKFRKQIDSNESFALILVKDALVDAAYAKRNLKKGAKSRIRIEQNENARTQGYNDGNNFDSNRRIIQNR